MFKESINQNVNNVIKETVLHLYDFVLLISIFRVHIAQTDVVLPYSFLVVINCL